MKKCFKCGKEYKDREVNCFHCKTPLVIISDNLQKQDKEEDIVKGMKKCPKCGKIYDDSWGICLICDVRLINITAEEIKKITEKEGWEYKIVKVVHWLANPKPDRLNELGALGWEAVNISTLSGDVHFVLMKRKI
ncbi:MAG: zinc ribbon domain-containing protein [Candidatus Omnitrophota bacterium]